MIIKVTPDVLEFINGNSTTLFENGEKKWAYLPYWFEYVGVDTIKIWNFEKLPADLKKRILEMRDINQVYYYEDKPYRILHEGKVKAQSILDYISTLNSNSNWMCYILLEHEEKWIDVVIYEPLYEECNIRICVKEKEDFYSNYKPKQ